MVPASVQGAEIPGPQELPPSLAPLTRRHSDMGWQDDVGRLIRRLEAVAQEQPDRAAAAAERPAPPRRPRPTGRIPAAAVLGLVAVLAAVAGVLLLGGGEEGGETLPPGASAGGPRTVTLGSDLRTAPSGERWYCSGGDAPPSCTFVLTRLPEVDRPVKAPFDGVVTRWRVQGAGGPIRLIVARGELTPGARSSLERVQGSAEQKVRSEGRQTFPTRLRIARGDVVGLQLSIGAYGNAPYSEGTWLELWTPPLGAERQRSDDSSTRSYELLYNASIERDRDGDGFGDVTQDACPEDAGKQDDC